jgi:hypothetical protein
VPLPARHTLRHEFERVFVAILGDAVADDDHRVADRARDGENFEICLGKIAEIVEIVHFVFDKEKCVLRIVGRGRGADDHASGVGAVTGNAVRGAGVAA